LLGTPAARSIHSCKPFNIFQGNTGVIHMRGFVRNVGFALAAAIVVLGLSATFEYQPVINALAR
jgi:hypothetical protein